jgi:NADH-quinone oxidoreductase subunit B
MTDATQSRPGRPAHLPPPERFDPEIEQTILLTKAEWLVDWGRKSSLWPLGFGLACCAIEMISTAMTKYDISRFGAEVFRATPRQADVMIVAGTVTHKMAPRVRRLWEQMSEPKWVIAMGACTVGGGPYFVHGYHVVKGVDKVVPVDIYLPGCPPRPEALLESIMRLQELVSARSKRLNGKDPGYTKPEPGSRQAVIDGLSPAEPWKTELALMHNEPKRVKDEADAAAKAAKAAAKAALAPKVEAPAAGSSAAGSSAAGDAAPTAGAPKMKIVTRTIKLGDPATDVSQWEEWKHGFSVPPRMTPRLEGMDLEKTIEEEVVDDSVSSAQVPAAAPVAEAAAPAAEAPAEAAAPAGDPATDPTQWEEWKHGFAVPPPMKPNHKNSGKKDEG